MVITYAQEIVKPIGKINSISVGGNIAFHNALRWERKNVLTNVNDR